MNSEPSQPQQTAPPSPRGNLIEEVPVLHPFFVALYPVLGLFAHNQAKADFTAVLRPGFVMMAAAFILWLALGGLLRNSHRAGMAASILILAAFSGWNVLEYGMTFGLDFVACGSDVFYYPAYAVLVAIIIGLLFWYFRPQPFEALRLGVLLVVFAAVLLFVSDVLLAPIFQRGPAWFMSLYTLAVAVLVVAVTRWQGDLRRVTRTLNWFGFFLLGLSVANIFLNRPARTEASQPAPLEAAQTAQLAEEGDPPPDIYLLVFGGFARGDVLINDFHYNLQPFLETLEAHGFDAAPTSVSNYPSTVLSMASMLNMDYLHNLAPPTADEEAAAQIAQGRIAFGDIVDWYHHNRVYGLLKQLGYDIYAFSPGNELLEPRATADVVLNEGVVFSEFEAVFLESSLVSRLVQATHYLRHRSLADMQHLFNRKRVLYTFDELGNLAAKKSASPRFIQAYFSIPEPPFLFDRYGDWPESAGYFTYGGQLLFRENVNYQQAYIDQLYATNRLLENVCTEIVENTSRPAVIIMASVPGPGSQILQRLSSGEDERSPGDKLPFATLMSVRFPPGVASEGIPDDLDTVNVFRVVFNQVFGTALPMLERRLYTASGTDPMQLEKVEAGEQVTPDELPPEPMP